MATIAAVYFLGRREGQLDSTTLLLGGIISASFLSAIIMFLMTTLAGRDLRGMVFWLMGDLSTPVPAGPPVDLHGRAAGRNRRDLHNCRGLESAAYRRARSDSSGRGRDARETGRVRFRIAADGAGRFRERSDWLCRTCWCRTR